jgi:DUF971 family protein
MTPPIPTSISRVARGSIEIAWSDGVRGEYTPRLLRDACPCATCRERRAQPPPPVLLPVLAPEEVAPLTIAGMKPVGQYAYSIAFSDGHSSGIYSLEYLRELAEPGGSCAKEP